MTPQEAFWHSWFGSTIIGLEVALALLCSSTLFLYFKPRLKIFIEWNGWRLKAALTLEHPK